MKNVIRLEELAMFGIAILIFNETSFAWWWFPALILLPDIGMLGYVINNKTGAFTYNLFHHKGLALLILVLGWFLPNEWLGLAGIILFAHASIDRVFGYGLKYIDSFKHTHLGRLDDSN